jgi:hypothetical protein
MVQMENQVKIKSRPTIPKEKVKEKEKKKTKQKMVSDQNNTLGRVNHERADDETASTNLPHAN